MRIDELTRQLHDARDAEPAADLTAGREAVTRVARRQQTRRVAAIAVCVIVVLGAFAATVSRVGNRDPGYATSTEGVTKLVPTDLPDGLRVKIIGTDPGSSYPIEDVHASVFAKPGPSPRDALTFVRARISSNPPGSYSPSLDVPTTTNTDADGNRSATIAAADGSFVAAISRTLPDAELIDAARRVRFAPNGVVDDATVPAGYERVVSNSSMAWFANTVAGPTLGPGWFQIYAAPLEGVVDGATSSNPLGSTTERSLGIAGQPATPEDLAGARWMLPNTRDLTVRGHPAVGGSTTLVTYRSESSPPGVPTTIGGAEGPGGGSTGTTELPRTGADVSTRVPAGTYQTVAWMENDHTLVTVSSANYTIEQLATIAEGLRVVPDFTSLEAATTTTTLPPNCRATEGGGSVCGFASPASPTDPADGGGVPCTTIATPPATGNITDQRRAAASAPVCQGRPTADDAPTTTTSGGASGPTVTTGVTATSEVATTAPAPPATTTPPSTGGQVQAATTSTGAVPTVR